MKLFIPVAGIIFSIGACCCGDMGDLEALSKQVEEVQIETPASGGDKPAEAKPSSGGSAVSGSCGRFKDWGIQAPSGFNVVACSDDSGSGGLVMQGAGSPADACKVIRSWAEGTGAKLTTEATMGGTTSLIYQKDGTQITAACTDATGQTTVSVALSTM